ncbi:PQQ-binding-like beta-propeller repeat protein [Denitrobaculum tricleocarpae]|uniref:PQQ-binding-like beta-propeller repeat protein n=1 Tax=Denitrobaculum tricleocarpae TaxID=2591009 RepID=A0A545TU09_9PROT|nr:PQQ-binding-like beta-propeller repeat protein [Denitrobaculum tricleocarpae]TQV80698.1 PQQ-binding-like beta-propeller repeat protein [Denitrobaculum tricleocarpae]
MLQRFLTLAAFCGLGLGLGACGVTDWFDSAEEPRLPGERIAILALDKGLTPDPEIADQQIILPKPFENQFWTHAGGNPPHAMYHLSINDDLSEAWSADIGEGSDDSQALLAQPIVVENVVFTMDALTDVSAYDTISGKQYWRVDLDPDDHDDGYFGGGIAYADGRIYVTTGFARVFALDARSGAIIWQKDMPGPMRAAPTVNGGRVFLVTLDNQMLALAADDGRRLWSHIGIQEDASLLGAASPAVAGGTVVVPFSSGEIIGLSVTDGRMLWSDSLSSVNRIDPLADLAHIRGQPVIDRGVVMAISHSGRMIALDLERGARAWDIDLGGVQTPWVAGDYVFVLTNDAQLVAVRRRDGRLRWVRPLQRFEDVEDQEDLIQWAGPVLASDRLIVAGSHGEAISISPYTGEVLGFIELPDGAALPPVVAGNSLYFVTDSAELVVLR